LKQAEEELVDLTEEELRKKVEKGDLKAIIFVLETKGAVRGWGRPQEGMKGNLNLAPISIIFNDAGGKPPQVICNPMKKIKTTTVEAVENIENNDVSCACSEQILLMKFLQAKPKQETLQNLNHSHC